MRTTSRPMTSLLIKFCRSGLVVGVWMDPSARASAWKQLWNNGRGPGMGGGDLSWLHCQKTDERSFSPCIWQLCCWTKLGIIFLKGKYYPLLMMAMTSVLYNLQLPFKNKLIKKSTSWPVSMTVLKWNSKVPIEQPFPAMHKKATGYGIIWQELHGLGH